MFRGHRHTVTSVQMAPGPLYIIQACLHAVSGGTGLFFFAGVWENAIKCSVFTEPLYKHRHCLSVSTYAITKDKEHSSLSCGT